MIKRILLITLLTGIPCAAHNAPCNAGQTLAPAYFLLLYCADLEGVVTHGGNPVEGAEITIDKKRYLTGSDGTYAIRGINPGPSQKITCAIPNYITKSITVDIDCGVNVRDFERDWVNEHSRDQAADAYGDGPSDSSPEKGGATSPFAKWGDSLRGKLD